MLLDPKNYNPKKDLIGGLAAAIGAFDSSDAFAVLPIHHATAPSYTFAHELFHIFGANHTKIKKTFILGAQDVISEKPWRTAEGEIDAWAYANEDAETPYQTIMAYNCPDRIRIYC